MLQADGEVWDPSVETNKADPLRPGHIPHQGTQHTTKTKKKTTSSILYHEGNTGVENNGYIVFIWKFQGSPGK